MLPSLAAVGFVMGTDTTAHGLERSQVFFVCFVFAFEPHLLALRGSKITDRLRGPCGIPRIKTGSATCTCDATTPTPKKSNLFVYLFGPLIFRGYSQY